MLNVPASLLLRTYTRRHSRNNLHTRPVDVSLVRSVLVGRFKIMRQWAYGDLLYEDYGIIENVEFCDAGINVFTHFHTLRVNTHNAVTIKAITRRKLHLLRCIDLQGHSFYTVLSVAQIRWVKDSLTHPPHSKDCPYNQLWQYKDYPWKHNL